MGNLLKYMRAKNCNNRYSSDSAITKIKWCSFLPHMVLSFSKSASSCTNVHEC